MNTDVLFEGFNEQAIIPSIVDKAVIEYLENNHKLLNEFEFNPEHHKIDMGRIFQRMKMENNR